jgi:DNA-binding transcriptional LysR family regulator
MTCSLRCPLNPVDHQVRSPAMHFCMARVRLTIMLNWDDLRFVLAVARAGSMSAAAKQLAVAQPTVGRRIAALEHDLGAKLFLHLPTGQQLSPTGSKLLARAERMEAEALAVERVAAGRDAGLRGRVTITASEWLIGSVLGPALAPFSERNTELELELLADVRHLSLARREADIALRPSKFEQAGVLQRQVATLSFGLYASDSYLTQHGMPDFAADCAGHALVAMSESLAKIPDLDWLSRFAAKARVAVRTNGRVPMVMLAQSGVGMACLPRFIGDATPGLRLLRTPLPGPERALYLGSHRDARTVPRVRACINFLSSTFERLKPALCPRAS